MLNFGHIEAPVANEFLITNYSWTDWIDEPGAIGFPTWSRDGMYVYYHNTSTEKSALLRVKVGQTHSEFLIDLRDMHRYGKYG